MNSTAVIVLMNFFKKKCHYQFSALLRQIRGCHNQSSVIMHADCIHFCCWQSPGLVMDINVLKISV